MKRFCFASFLLVIVLGLSACGNGEQSSEKASINTPIGPFTVQVGEPIQDSTSAAIVQTVASTDTLQAQSFRQRMKMASQRMRMMQGNTDQLRRRIVEAFAGRQLQMQLTRQFIEMADSLSVQADTAQVNQQFQKYRDQFPSEKAYQQQLARQNMTEDSLRALAAQQVRFRALRRRILESVKQPSASEIDSARRASAEQLKLQHILLSVPRGASPEATDSVQQRAQALIDSVQSGSDFAALARRHSDDTASAPKGGNLGWVSRDSNLVAPFKEAAFNLPKQQHITTKPVKTQFGYHIIRVADRRQGEMADTSTARRQLVQQHEQDAWRRVVEQKRDRVQATVRLNKEVVQADLAAPPEESSSSSSATAS